MTDSYKIRIKKGDFEIEVSGDKDFTVTKFDELSKSLENHPNTVAKSQSNKLAGTASPSKTTSQTLVEFLKDSEANGHPDKILVFAYYLFHHRNIDSFNVTDIEQCYSETRNAKPANINDAVNSNVEKGCITPVPEKKDDKKAWTITQKGDEHVENELKPNSG